MAGEPARSGFEWKRARQLTWVQVLIATFVPSGVAFFGFHYVGPQLIGGGMPAMTAWLSVAAVALSLFGLVAIVLLRREAKLLGISLKDRFTLRGLTGREWGKFLGILLVGLILTTLALFTVLPLIQAVGFTIPDYMPFFLNPAINPADDPSVVIPGIALKGNYGFLVFVVVVLLLNVFVEEVYFRAWMLPKLSGIAGGRAWVLNGFLFAFYHSFQLWLLVPILVASLFSAFVFQKSRSIYPTLIIHLIANVGLTLPVLLSFVV